MVTTLLEKLHDSRLSCVFSYEIFSQLPMKISLSFHVLLHAHTFLTPCTPERAELEPHILK